MKPVRRSFSIASLTPPVSPVQAAVPKAPEYEMGRFYVRNACAIAGEPVQADGSTLYLLECYPVDPRARPFEVRAMEMNQDDMILREYHGQIAYTRGQPGLMVSYVVDLFGRATDDTVMTASRTEFTGMPVPRVNRREEFFDFLPQPVAATGSTAKSRYLPV